MMRTHALSSNKVWFVIFLVVGLSCQTSSNARRQAEDDLLDEDAYPTFEFSHQELDKVPGWAKDARALCLVGHVESCEAVAYNKSPEQQETEWLEEQRERACRAKHTTSYGVYNGPNGGRCTDGWIVAEAREPIGADETRAQRAARLKRERQEEYERQREDAYRDHWYGRAIGAKLRTCDLAKQADPKAECDPEELDSLMWVSGLNNASDMAAIQVFSEEVSSHRARMKEACSEGDAESCWRWFLTHDVDGDASEEKKHTLLLQAVSSGSLLAWNALSELAWDGEQPLPNAETREKIKRDHEALMEERRKKSKGELESLLSGSAGAAFDGRSHSPRRLLYEACNRRSDMGACYQYERFGGIHRHNRPKREKVAERLYEKALEHCSSKKEGESCWVAGYTMEHQSEDLARAADAYKQGCEKGSPQACYSLGRLSLRDDASARALAHFEEACGLGYVPGCVMLGAHHAQGFGVTQDRDVARGHLEPACQAKSEDATKEVACFLLATLP